MEGYGGLLSMALCCMMFCSRSYKAFNFWGINLWNIHLPVALQPLAPVVPSQVMAPLAAFSFLPQDLWVSLEFSVAAFHSKWHRRLGSKHCWRQPLSHISPMQMAGSLAFHRPLQVVDFPWIPPQTAAVYSSSLFTAYVLQSDLLHFTFHHQQQQIWWDNWKYLKRGIKFNEKKFFSCFTVTMEGVRSLYGHTMNGLKMEHKRGNNSLRWNLHNVNYKQLLVW